MEIKHIHGMSVVSSKLLLETHFHFGSLHMVFGLYILFGTFPFILRLEKHSGFFLSLDRSCVCLVFVCVCARLFFFFFWSIWVLTVKFGNNELEI